MTIIGIIEIYDRKTGLQYAGAWLQEADALPPGITKEIRNLKMRLSWEEQDSGPDPERQEKNGDDAQTEETARRTEHGTPRLRTD